MLDRERREKKKVTDIFPMGLSSPTATTVLQCVCVPGTHLNTRMNAYYYQLTTPNLLQLGKKHFYGHPGTC